MFKAPNLRAFRGDPVIATLHFYRRGQVFDTWLGNYDPERLIFETLLRHQASLVAQVVKNLPTMQEMWVQSLSHEDPLEEEMTTHSTSILAWRIPGTEEPGRLQSRGLQRVGRLTLSLSVATQTNGNISLSNTNPSISI